MGSSGEGGQTERRLLPMQAQSDHPCGFLALLFAMASWCPPTFALWLTSRFPSSHSLHLALLVLPPRLRLAVALAAATRWPQPLAIN